VCNLHPTIHGRKGAVYADVGGKSVRVTRERLLSGELPDDLGIRYGVSGTPRDDASEYRTTVRQARESLGARASAAPRRADIVRVAEVYTFQTTCKQAKEYGYVEVGSLDALPPMSYTVATSEQRVVTVTADGKETENVAQPGDVIMSGPSAETYVVKAAKFSGLYDGEVGTTVIPNQSPREVAQYSGSRELVFTAPWGEDMVHKPGDYLVADGPGAFYRIAQAEYEETYNPLGS